MHVFASYSSHIAKEDCKKVSIWINLYSDTINTHWLYLSAAGAGHSAAIIPFHWQLWHRFQCFNASTEGVNLALDTPYVTQRSEVAR